MKTAFLNTCSRLGISRLARALTGRGVRILAYHGFCDGDEADFQPMLFMRAATFRARMQRLLAAGHRVVPLAEAVARLAARDVERGLAVVTIDDGWHGIYRHAWPVLREFGLPATVYVTSYYSESQLPVLNVLGRYLLWKSPRTDVSLANIAPGLDARHSLADGAARNRLADRLTRHADETLPPGERVGFLREIASRLEVDIDGVLARRTFHLMSATELRELSASGVDLQLHTHRHRFPPDDQFACMAELERNRRYLERLTGVTAAHFCYPSGEYRVHQKEWLRALGITSATTTRHGLSYAATDPLELPRFLDSDAYSSELFDAALTGVLALLREPGLTLRRALSA
jgi:peptidoglycan/xylan/chitin deacetylase (PgdA/CDA1 family)